MEKDKLESEKSKLQLEKDYFELMKKEQVAKQAAAAAAEAKRIE